RRLGRLRQRRVVGVEVRADHDREAAVGGGGLQLRAAEGGGDDLGLRGQRRRVLDGGALRAEGVGVVGERDPEAVLAQELRGGAAETAGAGAVEDDQRIDVQGRQRRLGGSGGRLRSGRRLGRALRLR